MQRACGGFSPDTCAFQTAQLQQIPWTGAAADIVDNPWVAPYLTSPPSRGGAAGLGVLPTVAPSVQRFLEAQANARGPQMFPADNWLRQQARAIQSVGGVPYINSLLTRASPVAAQARQVQADPGIGGASRLLNSVSTFDPDVARLQSAAQFRNTILTPQMRPVWDRTLDSARRVTQDAVRFRDSHLLGAIGPALDARRNAQPLMQDVAQLRPLALNAVNAKANEFINTAVGEVVDTGAQLTGLSRAQFQSGASRALQTAGRVVQQVVPAPLVAEAQREIRAGRAPQYFQSLQRRFSTPQSRAQLQRQLTANSMNVAAPFVRDVVGATPQQVVDMANRGDVAGLADVVRRGINSPESRQIDSAVRRLADARASDNQVVNYAQQQARVVDNIGGRQNALHGTAFVREGVNVLADQASSAVRLNNSAAAVRDNWRQRHYWRAIRAVPTAFRDGRTAIRDLARADPLLNQLESTGQLRQAVQALPANMQPSANSALSNYQRAARAATQLQLQPRSLLHPIQTFRRVRQGVSDLRSSVSGLQRDVPELQRQFDPAVAAIQQQQTGRIDALRRSILNRFGIAGQSAQSSTRRTTTSRRAPSTTTPRRTTTRRPTTRPYRSRG